MHRKAPSIDDIWECIFETTKPINRLNRVPGLDAESGSETWHTRYDEYGRLRNEPQTALVTGPLHMPSGRIRLLSVMRVVPPHHANHAGQSDEF